MKNICEMLGVEPSEKFGVVMKDGTPAAYGPYRVAENKMLDGLDRVADSMLGQIIRGQGTIVRNPLYLLKRAGGRYFYFDQNGNIQSRKNKESLIDIINALANNMFQDKECMTDEKRKLVEELRKKLLTEDSFLRVKDSIAREYVLSLRGKNEKQEEERDLDYMLKDAFRKSMLDEI